MDKRITAVTLIGLALFTKNLSDNCAPSRRPKTGVYVDLPSPTSLPCLVSSFKPESPEQISIGIFHIVPIDRLTASGTMASNASQSLPFNRY